MISVKAANRSGREVAKALQGTFRAMARGDSRKKKKRDLAPEDKKEERDIHLR